MNIQCNIQYDIQLYIHIDKKPLVNAEKADYNIKSDITYDIKRSCKP